MRHSFLSQFLPIASLTLPCIADGSTLNPPGADQINDPVLTKKLIHYWADFSCYKFSDGQEPSVKDQCSKACDGTEKVDTPNGNVLASYTCSYDGPESDARTGNPLTEEQKKDNSRKGEH